MLLVVTVDFSLLQPKEVTAATRHAAARIFLQFTFMRARIIYVRAPNTSELRGDLRRLRDQRLEDAGEIRQAQIEAFHVALARPDDLEVRLVREHLLDELVVQRVAALVRLEVANHRL